ncbi:hypothetical protein AB0I28_09360 [Phytomonospora sp. NPDC050363]|uniref:hypothetical protein n=1 Tax=Phytomonospora sp. NPDC050363 TaxID=3155642 RepID=UPI0033E55A12
MSDGHQGVDWPDGGGDPFDGQAPEAGRFYWGHERPSRVFPDDYDPPGADLQRAIPMGYTSLSLLERVALYDAGREVRVWRPDVRQGPDLPLQPFQLLLPPGEDRRHQLLGASWPVRFALHDGRELSARTGGPVLVCRALSHQGWH